MKTDATIRAKRPTGPVRSAREALEAFQRMNTYRDAEAKADARARGYTPGVHSFYLNLDRAGLYGGVADEWENVLGDWLREQADEPASQSLDAATTTDASRAFDEGVAAARADKPTSTNPYGNILWSQRSQQMAGAWLKGYDSHEPD